ncbi:MAG TPA: hypothetical protein VIO61_07355 [Anaerolineaceae bacterium]
MAKLQKSVHPKQSPLGEIKKQNSPKPGQSVPSSDLQRAVDHPELAKPSTLRALSRQSGNRSISGLLQAKLLVGAADDFYEREADQVASSVVQAMALPPSPGVRREDIDGVQLVKEKLAQSQHLHREDKVHKKNKVEIMKAHLREALSMYNHNLRITADKVLWRSSLKASPASLQ